MRRRQSVSQRWDQIIVGVDPMRLAIGMMGVQRGRNGKGDNRKDQPAHETNPPRCVGRETGRLPHTLLISSSAAIRSSPHNPPVPAAMEERYLGVVTIIPKQMPRPTRP